MELDLNVADKCCERLPAEVDGGMVALSASCHALRLFDITGALVQEAVER